SCWFPHRNESLSPSTRRMWSQQKLCLLCQWLAVHPYRAPFVQQVQRVRRENRITRYQEMVELQKQGMTTAQVAKQLGLSTRTIRRWLAQEHLPEQRQRR